MNLILYAILDKVTGIYGDLFAAVNVAQAVRKFDYLMSNSPMVSKDCALYTIGSYDNSIGIVTPLEKPDFVKNYEVL